MIELNFLLVLFGSLFILISNHPVYCLFSLILTFINFSIILLNFNLEFLALSYIIVYVGAICVLFIFVILLLNIRIYNLDQRNSFLWFTIMSIIVLIIIYSQLDFSLIEEFRFPNYLLDYERDISLFGKSFFNYNWQYLIVTVLLLLLAVVATIAVSLKKNVKKKIKFDFFY